MGKNPIAMLNCGRISGQSQCIRMGLWTTMNLWNPICWWMMATIPVVTRIKKLWICCICCHCGERPNYSWPISFYHSLRIYSISLDASTDNPIMSNMSSGDEQTYPSIWGFPNMRVALVIIHFDRLGVSLTKTIQLLGIPHDSGNPQISQ